MKRNSSRYQWTRKVGRKTVTVSLSRAQYQALNEAVKNERTLWKIVGEMERLSRRILFQTLPDTKKIRILFGDLVLRFGAMICKKCRRF